MIIRKENGAWKVVGAAWYSVSLRRAVIGGPAIAEVLGGRSILEGPTFLWGDLEPLCTPWTE